MTGKLQIENCKLRIANCPRGTVCPSQASRHPSLQFAICNSQFAIVLGITALTTAGCNQSPHPATTASSPPVHVAFAADPPARSRLAAPGPESWPSFRRDLLQTGVAPTKLPEKLDRLWTFKAGEKDAMIKSTAAIVGDVVYVASLNGELYCVNRQS